MGELAHYIVETYEQGDTTKYLELFSSIESVLGDGEREVQNLVWVGLLEGIQNIASHRSFGADVFREWLGPKSLYAWDEIIRGMRKVAEWESQQRASSDRSNVDLETALSQVENPELRRIIEQMYRKNK